MLDESSGCSYNQGRWTVPELSGTKLRNQSRKGSCMKKLGVVLATVLTVCGYAAAMTEPGTVDMTRNVAGLGEVSAGILGFAVTLTITAAPDIADSVTALAVEETLPAGWSYMGVSGSPMPMDRFENGILQLFWIDTPDMSEPVVLEYYLEAPAALADATVTGRV